MDSVSVLQAELRKIETAFRVHNLSENLRPDAAEALQRCSSVDGSLIVDAIEACSNAGKSYMSLCPPETVRMRNLFLRDVLITTQAVSAPHANIERMACKCAHVAGELKA